MYCAQGCVLSSRVCTVLKDVYCPQGCVLSSRLVNFRCAQIHTRARTRDFAQPHTHVHVSTHTKARSHARGGAHAHAYRRINTRTHTHTHSLSLSVSLSFPLSLSLSLSLFSVCESTCVRACVCRVPLLFVSCSNPHSAIIKATSPLDLNLILCKVICNQRQDMTPLIQDNSPINQKNAQNDSCINTLRQTLIIMAHKR